MLNTMLAAAGLAAALAASAPGSLAAQRYEERSRLDTTFSIGRGGTLDISLISGDIIVRASSGNDVRVNATSEEGFIRAEASGSRVTLGVRSNRGRMGDTKFDVAVPVGTRVLAHTTSGDITVRGVRGEVEAHSTSGDIKIDDADRINFEAVSGDVEATRVAGTLTGTSVSGDLTIDGGVGDVDLESVSGEIHISHGRARTLRLKSVSGDLIYDGTVDPSGRYTFDTHSGEVKMTLPDGVGANISIDTFNGDVDSDFPLTLTPNSNNRGRHMQFTIGSGGARVGIETFSGDIQLRRGRR
jgi:DUF4097 and DUF4098 domain-containing protein YvlB